MGKDKSKIFFWAFVVLLFGICLASILLLKPTIIGAGDGATYIEAMRFLQEGAVTTHVPYRVLTTFLGLETIILFSKIFGSIDAGWLIMNISFYFLSNIVFYKLTYNVFRSEHVAFLSSLFLATNYAMVCFGPNYWMDIGGWTFYLLSLYFSFHYLQNTKRWALLCSATSIGLGGLFKEYALLGTIPISILLICENWPDLLQTIKKAVTPALVSVIPMSFIYIFVYWKFNYTYATWFSMNHEHFIHIYDSRIIEYFKSFGSLYTFLAFFVIAGAYYFIRDREEIVQGKKNHIFILSVWLSALPVFIWPAITQRILFITVPGALLISSFCFKKFEKYWWAFLPILTIYTIVNFAMNAFILPNFNLPF